MPIRELMQQFKIDADNARSVLDFSTNQKYTQKDKPLLKDIGNAITHRLPEFKIKDPTILEIARHFPEISIENILKISKYLVDEKIFDEIPRYPKIAEKSKEISTADTTNEIQKSIPSVQVSRGFEIAGDTFKFFVRVDNHLETIISKVHIRLSLPETLELDNKTPSTNIELGIIPPKKYKTAIYFMYCVACADDIINGLVHYIDPMGILQSLTMEPFQLQSCKFVSPRQISLSQFNQKKDVDDKKEIQISLKTGTEQRAILAVQQRLTMSQISRSDDAMDLFGQTRDGSDIGVSMIMKEINGIKTLLATVFSQNHQVQMGVASDIMEALKDIKRTTDDILDKVTQVLKVQMDQYDQQIANIERTTASMKELNERITALDTSGDFEGSEVAQRELSNMRAELKNFYSRLDDNLGELAGSVEQILARQNITIQTLQSQIQPSDWEKVKTAWEDYRAHKRTLKDILLGATKELGKRGFKSLISALTGGLINIAKNNLPENFRTA